MWTHAFLEDNEVKLPCPDVKSARQIHFLFDDNRYTTCATFIRMSGIILLSLVWHRATRSEHLVRNKLMIILERYQI